MNGDDNSMTAPTLAKPQAMALLWSEPTRAKLSRARCRLPRERCSSYAIDVVIVSEMALTTVSLRYWKEIVIVERWPDNFVRGAQPVSKNNLHDERVSQLEHHRSQKNMGWDVASMLIISKEVANPFLKTRESFTMKESANWNTTDPKRTLMSRVKHTKTPALLGPPLPPLEYMAVEQSMVF